MANANWQGGRAKSRGQAKAWLRHNDRDRRADPQVDHTNREIDKARTERNFEVGPTAHMTLEQKYERLDTLLDSYGYPIDADLGTRKSRVPTCMQGIVIYVPEDLDNDNAEDDGRLEEWAECAVAEAARLFGEENIVAAYVDVDEVHDYTSADSGATRRSRRHIHLYVVPVCEVKLTMRSPVYVRPDGTETLDADEAEQVYLTPSNAETDDPDRAARDDNGEPVTGPKCARLRSGRRKYKRQKREEAKGSRRMLRGSEFCSTQNIIAFNRAVHEMTLRRFGIKWNVHEPGTYRRNPDVRNRTVEELKSETAAREASREAEARIAQTEEALTEAQRILSDVEREAREIKAKAATAQVDAKAARKAAEDARAERDLMQRHRDLLAGESYSVRTSDGHLETRLGVAGLEDRLGELRAAIGDEEKRLKEIERREAGVTEREEAIRARERRADERSAVAERRADSAIASAREHDDRVDSFLSHARALVERFVGGATERFCSKLDSLVLTADRALKEESPSSGRTFWTIVRSSAKSVSSFMRNNRNDPAVHEWSELEFTPDTELSRIQKVSAQLYWFAGVALQRSNELLDNRSESVNWHHYGQEAYNLSNMLYDADADDPLLVAWADGDEFLLERLEESRPEPFTSQSPQYNAVPDSNLGDTHAVEAPRKDEYTLGG